MPLIQIHLIKGRTPEKKERLIKEVTENVSNILECPQSSVRIIIQEMEPEHFGIAGESVKKRNEKEGK